MTGDVIAPEITPDAVERMLQRLARPADAREVDRLLEHVGGVLHALDTAYAEHGAGWSAWRRMEANAAIHRAFEAVNDAVLALVVDGDADGAAERLTDALPVMRRAWVVQMIKVV